MLRLLIEKELKGILLSPKFVSTFAVCSILILLSVFIGIQGYSESVDEYNEATQLSRKAIEEATSWWGVTNQVFREPSPMQVFAAGVNNDIGRRTSISTWTEPKLENSHYSDDPLFAVFRFIDFTFIFQVVLSLFAILFTYNAINGEREDGTLKLAFSNAIPRAKYLLAKFVGSWLGLVIPLMIPIALACLIVVLFVPQMDSVHWAKFATLLGVSLLYFTFFIAFGLLVSALTRRSAVSFLILLVCWVVFVLIVPRASAMVAGQVVAVPSVAEVEAQLDRYRTDRWDQYRDQRRDARDTREAEMAGMDEAQRENYQAMNQAMWQEEDDEMREAAETEIAEFNVRLNEDLQNRKDEQEVVAFTMARFSPASAYQFAAMNLAGTNTSLKKRYSAAMRDYKDTFSRFVNDKRNAERRSFSRGRRGRSMMQPQTLDVSELPQFAAPEESYGEVVQPAVKDFVLLSIYIIVAFGAAFLAFVRYDVR